MRRGEGIVVRTGEVEGCVDVLERSVLGLEIPRF